MLAADVQKSPEAPVRPLCGPSSLSGGGRGAPSPAPGPEVTEEPCSAPPPWAPRWTSDLIGSRVGDQVRVVLSVSIYYGNVALLVCGLQGARWVSFADVWTASCFLRLYVALHCAIFLELETPEYICAYACV